MQTHNHDRYPEHTDLDETLCKGCAHESLRIDCPWGRDHADHPECVRCQMTLQFDGPGCECALSELFCEKCDKFVFVEFNEDWTLIKCWDCGGPLT